MIQKIRNFYLETVAELKKSTWPTWGELWESTVVVIVTAMLLAVFVFAADSAVRAIVRVLT